MTAQGKTLLSASTADKGLRSQIRNGGNREAATRVGQAIAERSLAAGIQALCLDRGCFKYHGRVAAVADAVREAVFPFSRTQTGPSRGTSQPERRRLETG